MLNKASQKKKGFDKENNKELSRRARSSICVGAKEEEEEGINQVFYLV